MKMQELPESVQAIAASLLAEAIRERVDLDKDDRTVKADAIAKTVQIAFEKLFTS